MTFKRRGLGVQQDKAYFQVVLSQVARGSRHFEYVTEDDAATVEGASYISTATADGQLTIDEVAVGDLIWYWQVTTADDDQTIEDDKASGVSDNKIYRVTDNDGTALTLAETTLGATGSLSTSGTPVSGDLAEFTNSATVRGRTLAELDLLTATDAAAAYQPLDADLTAVAALTTTAAGLSTLEIADPGADRILAWDDTAGAVAAIAIAAITAEASPASGDFFLAYTAEGALVKVDYDDMPAGGGSGDVTKVGTPVDNQLGVWTGDGTIEGDADLTYDGSALTVSAKIFQVEATADAASVAGFGQWWVKDDAPNRPMFTDDGDNVLSLAWLETLAATANGEGASLIGIEDSGGLYTATDVEAALVEVKTVADANVPTAAEDATDYSSTAYNPSSGYGVSVAFTGAQDHLIEFPAGLTVGSRGIFYAPSANTLDVRRVTDSSVSINGIAANGALAGDAGIVPAGGWLEWEVIAANTILIKGTTNADQSLVGALTIAGLLTASGGAVISGAVDMGGAGIEVPNGSTVSGTLTMAAHGGGVYETSGNCTITPAAGFTVTLKLGGAHEIDAGGTAHTGASGDVVTVICFSTDNGDVKLFQTVAASVIDLPTS